MHYCRVTSVPDKKKHNWSVIKKSFENLNFGPLEGVEVEFEKIVVYVKIF